MSNFNVKNRPYNQARKDYVFQSGGIAELRFKRAAEALGFVVDKATLKEDRFHHVDFYLSIDGGKWAVDVKSNNIPDQIWCEFKNVQGNLGWMYGKSTIIAFDMPEEGGFSIVDRVELAKWCESNVKDEYVSSKNDAHLLKYTRAGNDDVITKLYLTDLKSVPSYRVWKYFTDYQL